MSNKGRCRICGKTYVSSGMSRHLLSCIDKESMTDGIPERLEKLYEIHVTDKYQKDYWLFIEINGSEKLKTLDKFLREIWCECCGHLSMFTINGSDYSCLPDSIYAEYDMNVSISKVLYEGLKFTYEYDFGSSTDLILTVKNVIRGKKIKDGIRLLARNEMPEDTCSVCKKEKAAYINTYARSYDDVVFLCEKCNDLLNEGELDIDVDPFALRDVCNSPRMGVCGYCGESDVWD